MANKKQPNKKPSQTAKKTRPAKSKKTATATKTTAKTTAKKTRPRPTHKATNKTANKTNNKANNKSTNKRSSNRKKPPNKKTKATNTRSTWVRALLNVGKGCVGNRFIKRLILLIVLAIAIIIGGFFLPQNMVIPVKDATEKDWHKNSFWFYPWGRSGVHRGIDIFAPVGRPVLAADSGLVIESATRSLGGNVITVLGAKWRLHYYAHLSEKHVRVGYWVNAGDVIGSVGTTGNAVGKTPHLHYSIRTIFPYFWRSDKTPYGSLKKWYINPTPYFHDYLRRHNDTD